MLQGDTLKEQHFVGALPLSPPGTLHNQQSPGSPVLLPQFPKKAALNPLSPKMETAPHIPSKLSPGFPPSPSTLQVLRGAAGQVLPGPGSASSGTQRSTFPADLAPPQGSYQQLPGAPAHTLISAGLHILGLGCPALPPQPHCRGSEHPVGHTQWDECLPQSWLPRKLLQPGKTEAVTTRRVY